MLRENAKFFLQMSGYPGSGRSTLAKEIAKHTGAVVVDHDIVKTALLEALDSDMDPKRAGQIAYHMDWSLVDYHLSLGHNVILDSPCLYAELLEKGTSLSKKHQVRYKYVECFLSDNKERDLRLRTRERLISQVAELPNEIRDTVLTLEASKMKRPADAQYLTVDTARPLDSYMDEVWAYLNI